MSYPFPDFNAAVKPTTWWTTTDIVALLCTKMSPDDWRPVTGACVVMGESGGNPFAVGKPVWSLGSPAHLSVDLGLFQLNSHWQGATGPTAFNPFVAWEKVWQIINYGRTGWAYNWTPWIAFTNGSYLKHQANALAGLRNYRSIMGLPPTI